MSSFFDFLLQQNITIRHLVLSLVVLVAAFVLTRLGRRLLERYIEAPARRYRLSKLIGRAAGLLALVLIIAIWSPGMQTLITVLTVVGAGLAISMRETLLSFAGWLDIAFRTPFTQGDRIEIGGVRGDVVDIRLFHTTLMEIGGWVDADQSTGRLVHVPNSKVFQEPLYNYTQGFNFIWHELSVTVTFRSDWQAARQIILELAQEKAEAIEQKASRELRQLARKYLVHYNILTPFVYVRNGENGIQLTLRFLCEARKRRGTEHTLTIGLLEAFAEHDGIEIAYPMLGVQQFKRPQFGPPPGADDGPPPTGSHDAQQKRSPPRDTT